MSSGAMADVRIERDLRIPMRDGIHLAANLYLPEAPGRYPALLQYTPYLKDGMGGRGSIEVGQIALACRGYACLSLDFRGYGESEGVPAPPFAPAEKLDGHDALAWIAGQPWCTGRTGIWGISYGGNTALSIASTRPPSLGAIVAIHAIDNEYTGAAWPHRCRGALVGEIDWGFRVAGIQLLPPLRFGKDWTARWRARLEAIDQPFTFHWHTMPPATWATWATDIEAIEAPTFAVSAWHDSYPRETVAYYDRLQTPRRLLLGPWKHELPDLAVHEPIGFFETMAEWFDRWLKGRPDAADVAGAGGPAVTFFEQLGDGWRTAERWPPATAATREFFAGADGTLSTHPALEGEDVYRVDPTVGLAALPWDWTTPTPATPPDISPDDHRALAWTSEPQADGLRITGLPEVAVVLRSDRPDVPLRAWLADVAPGGFSTLISQGWVRPAHLVGGPLDPARAYEVWVPLNPTSYRLPAGHRLRLAVAGSHFPALVPAPDGGTFRVVRAGRGGTRLRLPVEPEDAPHGPAPAFGPPVSERPTAQLEARSEHSVRRALDDRSAGYELHRKSRFRLDGGAELVWELDARIGVERDRPEALRMESRQVWRVVDGPARIEVSLAMWQTFERTELRADVSLDGRPFFAREWRLDLRTVPWQIVR
jgi:predicted acyl esterase